ncbi:MAG: hypothetical protein K2X38_15650 [Gemmataceae bacterium]|nr:hypothetical protein [Gemmataceae bacterium]
MAVSPRIQFLVWLGIYLIPASLIAQPLLEHDTGWHLRTAEWILENGEVPTSDPFSTIDADRPLIAYSWLFALLLHTAHQAFGLVGILLWRTVMGCLIVAAIHAFVARRCRAFLPTACMVGSAAIALSSTLMAERPALFTMLFALWTLDAIFRLRESLSDRSVWLLPIGYALWANLHIQFVHGLVLLFIPWFAAMIAAGFGLHATPSFRSPAWNRLTLLGLACFAGTFANPYGPRIWSVVLSYGQNREIYELFEELKSLRFRDVADWMTLAIFAAAVFRIGRLPRVDAADIALLAACAYFSFHARHEAWLVVLASVAILCRDDATAIMAYRWDWLAILATSMLVTAVIGFRMVAQQIPATLETAWRESFPETVANAIADDPTSGPVVAPIEWGGYLEWRLPLRRIAIDGRAQLHGGARTKRFDDLMKGRAGWERDPILDEAAFVVVPPFYPLASLLLHDARYERIAGGDVWLFRRRR